MEENDSTKLVEVVRADDFVSLYANNVTFDSTVFDLRIFFGHLDRLRSTDKVYVNQKATVTLSWPEAKLLAIYVGMMVSGQEQEVGAIVIPQRVKPAGLEDSETSLPLEEMVKLLIERAARERKGP